MQSKRNIHMRKSIVILLGAVLLVISGCDVLELFSGSDTSLNTYITDNNFDSVIFDEVNSAQSGLEYEFNDPIIDYWTPTDKQVGALEAGLVPFLEAEIPPDDYRYGFWDELDTYKRQYFGVTFEEGEPLIFANYFCVDAFDYWQEGYVSVADGGDCFFRLLYDPVTDTFLSLRINGEA
jgi:hypothetical protein